MSSFHGEPPTERRRTAAERRRAGQAERRRDGLLERERALRPQLLADVGRRASAILSRAELLRTSAHLIQEAFRYFMVNIFLVDGEDLVLRACTLPEFAHRIGRLRMRIGREGINGWVAGSGEPLNVADVRVDARYSMEQSAEKAVRSELAVPILLKGSVVGTLDAQSGDLAAFNELDVFTLQTVAAQLAVALENARLYEELTGATRLSGSLRSLKTGLCRRVLADVRALLPGRLLVAQLLHGAAPGDQLVQHGVQRGLVHGVGLERGEVLEVREQGKRDLGPDVGHPQLSHDQAQMLHGPDAARGPEADESRCLVFPCLAVSFQSYFRPFPAAFFAAFFAAFTTGLFCAAGFLAAVFFAGFFALALPAALGAAFAGAFFSAAAVMAAWAAASRARGTRNGEQDT